MASDGFKCNKPELVAIYRLEFYKNKKKWKFTNERKEPPQPASKGVSPKTAGGDKLNETYRVEPSSDSDKESSLLNNAFMHVIPTDDTPEEEGLPSPLTSPQCQDVWTQPDLEPSAKPCYPIAINSGVAVGSQSQRDAHTLGAFTNQPQATASQVYNPVGLDSCAVPTQPSARTTLCSDQRQPDVNLELLLRTSGRTPATLEHTNSQQTTEEPWQSASNVWTNEQTPATKNLQSPELWTKPPPIISNSQPRSQHMPSVVSPTGPRLFNPNPWSIPPPTLPVTLQNKEMLADFLKSHGESYLKQGEKLPQSPPADCLQMLLCPDTWKKQATPNKSAMNPDAAPATEPLLLRNQREMSHQNTIRPNSFANLEQAPSAPPPFYKRLVSENWINKQVPPPDNWTNKQGSPTAGTLTNRESVPPPETWPSKLNVPPQDTWPDKQSIPAPDTTFTSNQSVPLPSNWTNKYSVPTPDTLTNKHSVPPSDNWTDKQRIPPPDNCTNQTRKVSQYNHQRSPARPSQLVTPGYVIQTVHQEPNIKAPPPTPEGCSTEPWCDFQKVQDAWINPAQYANLEEIQQNFWTQQAWQKDDDYINQEWCPSASEDVPDGAGEEAFPPYSAADQNTLREHCSLDSEALSPEQVRQRTAAWLARLLALDRAPSDGGAEGEHCQGLRARHCPPDQGRLLALDRAPTDGGAADEPCQGGLDESADFIREAHNVPHSSEKDPNETREWPCACLPPAALPALPPRRLRAALRHAARGLRDVLREQLLRDRLRTQTLQSTVEYPTRDTGLFPHELVVGGSHVGAPAALGAPGALGQAEGPERLIRIAMGRPYRL